jgi:uncharacterized protein YbjT (DUF2867 family)
VGVPATPQFCFTKKASMKIIITGSLGNIGRPLATKLVQLGHSVTVISTNKEKTNAIEAIGAVPAIGRIQDRDFLIRTFTGADAVYCMNPFDFTETDLLAWSRNTDNYIQAIQHTGVQRVVVLSGWVAHLLQSVHPEAAWHALSGPAVTLMRPGSFYSNFYALKDMIRQQGYIASVYGGEDMIAFVAPEDIADAVVEELTNVQPVNKVRYVASDELTCNQAAGILGKAIGKPDLKWIAIPEQQLLAGLEAAGMPAAFAGLMAEMQSLMHSGKAQKDYYLNKPAVPGKIKFENFAREFAIWYHHN